MRVKCINQGNFKNLTLEKEYYCEESNDVYIVICNDGTQRNYSKRYFEVIEEPVEEVIEPVVERKEFTFALTLGEEDDYESGIYCNINGEEVSVFSVQFGIAGNCGVISISGISFLFGELQKLKNEDKLNETIEYAFEKIIKELIALIQEDSWGLVLFSTNTHDMSLITLMDEMADYSTDEFKNPNSGNMCKLWHFFINQ